MELTEDQYLHACGIDLDELYGTRDMPKDEAESRVWLDFFEGAAKRLGVSIRQLPFFPSARICDEIEAFKGGKIPRAFVWSALCGVLSEVADG